MRQEWVGLKIPVGSKKARKALSPTTSSCPPRSQKIIVIICLGAGLGRVP